MLGDFRVSPPPIRATGAMCAGAGITQITRHIIEEFFWKMVTGGIITINDYRTM